MSHLLIELYSVWWIPPLSRPRTEGSNSASGARKRSFPIVITLRGSWLAYVSKYHFIPNLLTWPSGSSYVFSTLELCAAVCSSLSKSRAT